MKPLLPLLWLALIIPTLQAQSLTCSIELFRIEGEIKAGPPDLTGRQPYAVQTFTVAIGQPQNVKTVVNGTTINSGVTVNLGKEQDHYQAVLDLAMVERGQMSPHLETTPAVKTQLAMKLNQPLRVAHMSQGSGSAQIVYAWQVILTP